MKQDGLTTQTNLGTSATLALQEVINPLMVLTPQVHNCNRQHLLHHPAIRMTPCRAHKPEVVTRRGEQKRVQTTTLQWTGGSASPCTPTEFPEKSTIDAPSPGTPAAAPAASTYVPPPDHAPPPRPSAIDDSEAQKQLLIIDSLLEHYKLSLIHI